MFGFLKNRFARKSEKKVELEKQQRALQRELQKQQKKEKIALERQQRDKKMELQKLQKKEKVELEIREREEKIELERQQKELKRLEENEQICFAMQVTQGLYQDTSEKWTSLASVEAAEGGEDTKIELPQALVNRMRAAAVREMPTIVEVVIQNSSPLVKIFFRWGGAGEPVDKMENARIVTKQIGDLAQCSEESIEQDIVDTESFKRARDLLNECIEVSGFCFILV